MPLFDLFCTACQHDFEELVFGDDLPACPQCGAKQVQKRISAPKPPKSKKFPFKIGPVHPVAKMGQKKTCPGACGSGGGTS